MIHYSNHLMGVCNSTKRQKNKEIRSNTVISQSIQMSSPSNDQSKKISTSDYLKHKELCPRNDFSNQVEYLESQKIDLEQNTHKVVKASPLHSNTMKNENFGRLSVFERKEKMKERKSLITLISYENKLSKEENRRGSNQRDDDIHSVQNNHFGGNFMMAGGMY